MSGSAKILIVDDEPGIQLTARATLETAGYTVLESRDGEAALALLRRTRVDLVLLDLRMPLLDGMEVLSHLRDHGDKTPVVVITAHGDIPDAVAALKLGAVDFLQKPLTPPALRAVVASALEAQTRSAAAALRDLLSEKLAHAQKALDALEFDEAEGYLAQARGLDPRSAEAARLLVQLRERRDEHEGPYRILRGLFPVGRPARASARPGDPGTGRDA